MVNGTYGVDKSPGEQSSLFPGKMQSVKIKPGPRTQSCFRSERDVIAEIEKASESQGEQEADTPWLHCQSVCLPGDHGVDTPQFTLPKCGSAVYTNPAGLCYQTDSCSFSSLLQDGRRKTRSHSNLPLSGGSEDTESMPSTNKASQNIWARILNSLLANSTL